MALIGDVPCSCRSRRRQAWHAGGRQRSLFEQECLDCWRLPQDWLDSADSDLLPTAYNSVRPAWRHVCCTSAREVVGSPREAMVGCVREVPERHPRVWRARGASIGRVHSCRCACCTTTLILGFHVPTLLEKSDHAPLATARGPALRHAMCVCEPAASCVSAALHCTLGGMARLLQ